MKFTNVTGFSLVLASVVLPSIAAAQCPNCPGGGYGNGRWGMMGGWGGWAPLTLLSNLIFWVAIIALGLYLFKKVMRSSEMEGSQRAIDILRERYAKGELTKEEFEQQKKDIQNS